MSSTATDPDALHEPIATPAAERPEARHPDDEQGVGDIDDLPRPVPPQYE